MRPFACKVCAEKDATIARLEGVANRMLQEKDRLVTELLHTAREIAGLQRVLSDQPSMPRGPDLDHGIELFLDAKFMRGTAVWRQQRGEAVKLAAEGLDAERICDILAKGEPVEY